MQLYYLDLFGTAIFALSGVLMAARKQMDFIGVLVLATVVAIGGGTLRDLLLDVDAIFWVADNAYLYVIFGTAVLGVGFLEIFHRLNQHYWIPVCDAVGMATFLGIGLTKALDYGTSDLVAIILGTMTAVGGGMIRDLLAGKIPFVLKREIYAVACIAGGMALIAALNLGAERSLALWLGMATTLIIRLLAIFKNLSLPVLKIQ